MAMPMTTAPNSGFEHAILGQTPARGITPVMRLFRAWQREYELACGRAETTLDDEVYSFALAGLRQIERRLMVTPCQTAEDAIAKLLAFTCYGQDFADDDEGRGAKVLRDARHLTGEGAA